MHVKQISNLFDLMALFVKAKKPLTVRDIVEEFSWPRSSVFNMVSTMVKEDYLYQPAARGGYYPTSKWMDLARALSDAKQLPESAHGLLEELMHRTGESMFLAGPEGTSVVFLDLVETSADIRYIASVGQRLPIHVTAAGRAILAQYSPAERAAILKRIKYQDYVDGAFMTPAAVEQDIQSSLKHGWYYNRAHYQAGVAGIAVPFPFCNRRNAIVLGGPVSRIEARAAELGVLLRDSVRRFLQDNA
jgi:DNA-binding IclR family transcriptional regulator